MQPDIISLHKDDLIINQREEVSLTRTVLIPHKSIVCLFHISFIEFYIKKEGVRAVAIDYVSGPNWACILKDKQKQIF